MSQGVTRYLFYVSFGARSAYLSVQSPVIKSLPSLIRKDKACCHALLKKLSCSSLVNGMCRSLLLFGALNPLL